MEQEDILNPNDEVHLFISHRIFLPRINRALSEMESNWSHHPLSSANNRSPRQLWHLGMTNLLHLDPTSIEDAQIGGWDEYGVDEEAPMSDVNTDNNVNAPPYLRFVVNMIYSLVKL